VKVDGPGPGTTEVVVTDLEMTAADQLRPAREPDVPVRLVRPGRPTPELSRFFYRSVGGEWYWLDRLGWTYDEWLAWVSAPGHELWSAWVEDAPAGYVELDRQSDGVVEVAYFGLLPEFTGLGIGGWLLTEGVRRAWAVPGTTRVWLHTCELDSERALANYLARGFVITGTHVEHWDLSHPTPGPWRGSR